MMRTKYSPFVLLIISPLAFTVDAQSTRALGDTQIRALAGPSDIVITTTERLAGAVDSVLWNGKEFIDSFDHGRQIQSATNFDVGTGLLVPGCFSPSEAGSASDFTGPTSTSILKSISASGNVLRTETQMAFWLGPGEMSEDCSPSQITQSLSDHILRKQMTIGYRGLDHVIEHICDFVVPSGEGHTIGQFAAVTGFMPGEFSEFWTYDPSSQVLSVLSDGPGEQPLPVILSTVDQQYAMGIISFQRPRPDGYGRWRFTGSQVTQWTSVFRVIKTPDLLPAGDYTFRNFIVVGTLNDCMDAMDGLTSMLPPPDPVYTFDFDEEGWRSAQASSVVSQSGGALVQTYAFDPIFDPFMNSPRENYDAATHQEFAMSVTVSGAPPGNLTSAMFFHPATGGFGRAPFTVHNGSQVVRFNVATTANLEFEAHQGIISFFRLDFPEGFIFSQFQNARIEIDWIALTNDPNFVPALSGSNPSEETFVKFSYVGKEVGSVNQPFNTFAEGLAITLAGGTLRLRPGDSSETLTISQAIRIETVGGTARIGVP